MKIYRIIYISTATSELAGDELIDICCGREENNKKLGISGILVVSNKRFLQALEGPFNELNDLYHMIAKDPRHKDIRIISYECTCTRDFPEWTMKIFSPSDHKGISDLIKAKYGLDRNTFHFPIEKNKAFALLLDVYKYFHNEIDFL